MAGNPKCGLQVYKVWMTSEAIPDEEILEEILAGMDDETVVEGLYMWGKLQQSFQCTHCPHNIITIIIEDCGLTLRFSLPCMFVSYV